MLSLTSQIKTPFHGWRAGVKLAAMALFTLGLFLTPLLWVQAVAVLMVMTLYALCGRRFFGQGLRMLRPLSVFVVMVMGWHIVTADLTGGALITLRLIAAVGLANLVTMTTRLDDMIDLALWLLRPFRAIGLQTGALGLAIALVVRFTPILTDISVKLGESWRARSPRRAGWRLVVPITLVAIDDAEHVAEALRARGGVPK